MKPEPMLMIPGPTPVPQAVLDALAQKPIGHRSSDFVAVMKGVAPRLQWLFQTKRPVYIYAASGTGAMEASLINTVNPGDEILVLSCGVFSQRFAEIGKALGLTVHVQEVPHGQSNRPEELEAFLKQNKNIKAVTMIHNETSTAVLNPVEQYARIIRENSDALVIVDTITGLGAAPFQFDDWGIDVAVSGSQKGFMLPPGLAVIAVSDKAMAQHRQVTHPGFYFNFSAHEKKVNDGQTPWTPAVTLITGLAKAMELMEGEGLPGLHQRHKLNRDMVRSAALAMGLELLVPDDKYASTSVTAIRAPEGISIDDIRAGLRNQFNITVANGQLELKGKIFRIGHLGAIFPRDIMTAVSCLEVVLHGLGYKGALGAGTQAAQQVLANQGREVLVSHG